MGLDFGPESVDGWLAGHVAEELGIASDVEIDPAAHELRLNGQVVQLTPLEFGVVACLQRHDGRAVSRATLLDEVWGYRHGRRQQRRRRKSSDAFVTSSAIAGRPRNDPR